MYSHIYKQKNNETLITYIQMSKRRYCVYVCDVGCRRLGMWVQVIENYMVLVNLH